MHRLATVKIRAAGLLAAAAPAFGRATPAAVEKCGEFVCGSLRAAKRFDALRDCSIDVPMRNTTATLQRPTRWAPFARVEAEGRGITRADVDGCLRSPSQASHHLLGRVPGKRAALRLDETRAYNAIEQVGNHGEVHERNVGKDSARKFARGLNAPWSRGGVTYPLPTQW